MKKCSGVYLEAACCFGSDLSGLNFREADLVLVRGVLRVFEAGVLVLPVFDLLAVNFVESFREGIRLEDDVLLAAIGRDGTRIQVSGFNIFFTEILFSRASSTTETLYLAAILVKVSPLFTL